MKLSNYFIVIMLIATAVFGYLAKIEREANLATQQELAVAMAINKSQEETILQIQKYQESQDRALSAMADSSAAIDKLRRTLTNSTNRVIASNEEFRRWFTLALDRDAVRLYNETRRISVEQDGGKQADGSSASGSK